MCVPSFEVLPRVVPLAVRNFLVRHIPNHWSKLVSILHWEGRRSLWSISVPSSGFVPMRQNFVWYGLQKSWCTAKGRFFFTPRIYNYFIPNSINNAIQATTRLCNIVRDRTGGGGGSVRKKNPIGRISFRFSFLFLFFFYNRYIRRDCAHYYFYSMTNHAQGLGDLLFVIIFFIDIVCTLVFFTPQRRYDRVVNDNRLPYIYFFKHSSDMSQVLGDTYQIGRTMIRTRQTSVCVQQPDGYLEVILNTIFTPRSAYTFTRNSKNKYSSHFLLLLFIQKNLT